MGTDWTGKTRESRVLQDLERSRKGVSKTLPAADPAWVCGHGRGKDCATAAAVWEKRKTTGFRVWTKKPVREEKKVPSKRFTFTWNWFKSPFQVVIIAEITPVNSIPATEDPCLLTQFVALFTPKIGIDRSILNYRLVVDLGLNRSSQKEYNKWGRGYLLLIILINYFQLPVPFLQLFHSL